MMSGTIRAAKADGSAAWTLMGISFLYGIFHAAGPGHGKAVISSYLVANDETWRRGIVLSFASAILQAFTAIAIVGIAAVLLGATAKAMGNTVRVIEIVSYALIILIGLRLLWVKGPRLSAFAAAARRKTHHDHAHHDHAMTTHHEHGHAHAHDHDHDHDEEASAWGHAHAPEPNELAGRHWWKRGLTAIVAVGLRPCSGAIIVLVFALAQGLFWIGVASTFVMGLGTAITVAAIATLAVGARGLAGRLAKGQTRRRHALPARLGDRGGARDRRVRRAAAHRLHGERAAGGVLIKIVRPQLNRLAVRGAVAGVVPGIAIAMQSVLRRHAFFRHQFFQRGQPVRIIGLAGVGIAGRLARA